MKIIFVGDLNPHGRAFQRKRALEELGHDVTTILAVPAGMSLDDKGALVTRVFAKLRLPLDLTGANRALLREVRRMTPDMVWIDKGNTIWPSTLAAVKRIAPETRLVSISEDDMFAPHNRSFFYTWGVKHYDFVFTTKSYNCDSRELPSFGARRVIFVENAYDPHLHRPVSLSPADIRELGAEVGFIGSYERERAASLLYLAENGVRARIWGSGWHNWRGHAHLLVEDRPLYGDDYAKAICATRINLCFLRKMNRDLQTSRTVEIPACGAFMLAERTTEHLRLFEEGKEAAYFGSSAELLAKARHYLEHDEERARIAAAGRQRCLTSGYSHHARLRRMLSIVMDGD